MATRGQWPTPLASSGTRGGTTFPRGNLTLAGAVMARAQWPTPTAGDSKSSGAAGYSTASGRHSGTTLTDAVVRFPTPRTTGLVGGAHAREAMEKLDFPRSQLNPTWVEWLMGWPLGWTDCAPLETGRFLEWQHSHSSSFELEEVGDGAP